MNHVCWPVGPDGRYRIDVELGGLDLRMMVDTGLVDRHDQIGIELDPSIFDRLRQVGRMAGSFNRRRRDSSGRSEDMATGELIVRLIDPVSRSRVGPAVRVGVARGTANVPSRVGTVFFHRLTGCRVDWDLDNKVWCVE